MKKCSLQLLIICRIGLAITIKRGMNGTLWKSLGFSITLCVREREENALRNATTSLPRPYELHNVQATPAAGKRQALFQPPQIFYGDFFR